MRVLHLLGASALVLAGLIACGSSASDAEDGSSDLSSLPDALDVNDVSILFPLGSDGLPRPNIAVDDSSAPLFGPGTFKTVTEFARSGSEGFKDPDTDSNEEILGQKPHVHMEDGVLDRKNWRVVAMRFDPCAPGGLALGFNDLKCVAEIRLVAQPFVDGQAQDVAAHLVYNLGFSVTNQKMLAEAVSDLQAIKAASRVPTTGEPLGVHPGLAAEVKSGGSDLAGKVEAFIKKYAARAQEIKLLNKVFSPPRLTAFMVKDGDFTTPGDAAEWYFMIGDVVNDAWSPTEISPVGKGVMFEKLSFKQKQGGEGDFEPKDKDGWASVGGHFLPKFKPAAADSEPLFLGDKNPATAHGVEDPGKSTVTNVDCVSCHTSTSRTVALDLPGATRLPAPKGITALVRRENLQSSAANVRNFGYFAGQATVSMRTLNETAGVADFLDRSVLKGLGPSTVVVDDKQWTCCMHGGGAGCEGTVCPTTDRGRRKAVFEANGAGGNPCSPDTSNEENDPRNTMEVSSDGNSLTLHGNQAGCLTLSMNGNFFSDEADITCNQLDLCTIKVKKAGPIGGDSARRLRNMLWLSEKGGAFSASDPNHQVSLGCDDTCSIAIK
jgi:hypothetical protein